MSVLGLAVAALLLIGSPARTTAQATDSSARFSVGSTQTMAGAVRFDFADLDARFAAAGLPKVANTAAAIGLGADVRAGRLLFGGGFQSLLTRNRTEIAYRTRMSGGYSLFDLGYAVVQTRRTSIYPVAGIGASHLSINVRALGDFSFDDGLHSPTRELGMSGTSAIAHYGVMAEQRFQRGKGSEFAFTLRAGMTRSFGSQAWQSDESRVTGGPSGARGSYVRLGFSKPLQRRSDAFLPMGATVIQTAVR
jgi:hypothetical protein